MDNEFFWKNRCENLCSVQGPLEIYPGKLSITNPFFYFQGSNCVQACEMLTSATAKMCGLTTMMPILYTKSIYQH